MVPWFGAGEEVQRPPQSWTAQAPGSVYQDFFFPPNFYTVFKRARFSLPAVGKQVSHHPCQLRRRAATPPPQCSDEIIAFGANYSRRI